jgi:hypothetical protein
MLFSMPWDGSSTSAATWPSNVDLDDFNGVGFVWDLDFDWGNEDFNHVGTEFGTERQPIRVRIDENNEITPRQAVMTRSRRRRRFMQRIEVQEIVGRQQWI